MIRPDSGALIINGREVHYASPHDALLDGVTTISQEISLLRKQTVLQNVLLGQEDARAGVTHGVPLDPKRLPDLPLVAHPIDPAFPDEHWYGIKCDPQDLEELTRTPKYHTWQGEQWLFCCGKPAVFAGTLNSRSLAKFAPRIGTSPQDILDGLVSQLGIRLPISLQDLDGGSVGVYVFRCRECQGLLSHVDCD